MNTLAFPINQLIGLREIRQKNLPHLNEVLQAAGELYMRACTARLTKLPGDESPYDRSWRKFLVGGCAWTFFVDPSKNPSEFTEGYNTKRTSNPSCQTRKCSEERILAKIKKMHYFGKEVEWIPAMMIVAEFQTDDESGNRCTTLHPCGRCRRMLVLNNFLRANTIIITAQPPDVTEQPPFAEINTLNAMVGYHNRRPG